MSAQRRRAAKPSPGRVSEPAGWLTWADPDPDTPAGQAAARRYKAGMAAYERILKEATQLFAHHGFDGTSIRDITVAAEVNVGAVTYHFGSKEELYFTVLQSLIGSLTRQVEVIATADQPPLERIAALVREFFRHVSVHRAMVPLMVREMAGERPLAPPIARGLQRMIPALVQVITQGQQQGSIRSGDPTLLALSSLAQPVYLNLARKGIATATGLDPADPVLLDRVVDHCVTIVGAALEARP